MFETRIAADNADANSDARANADWRLVWQSALGFWGLNFLWFLVLTFMSGEGGAQLEPYRLSPFVFGFGVTLMLWLALRLSAQLSMSTRLVIAAAASVPASIVVTTFAVAMFYFFDPAIAQTGVTRTSSDGTVIKRLPSGELQLLRKGAPEPEVMQLPPIKQEFLDRAPRLIADESFNSFFFFFAWGAFYVAVSSGRRLRDAERRAAGFERLAQASQLEALRYQINPHFLFNTLNSLSSLVMTRRTEEAEDMILGLSNFFRSTLTMDPTADATLAEEIAFQKLYLDIERARFPDRLLVEIDVPDDLMRARVPALLLQPLVENVIKHGVARSRETVTLTIRARRDADRLTLVVQDDATTPNAAAKDAGTGVGLANVDRRLSVRFAGRSSFRHEAIASETGANEAGFRVSMTMPLIEHAPDHAVGPA